MKLTMLPMPTRARALAPALAPVLAFVLALPLAAGPDVPQAQARQAQARQAQAQQADPGGPGQTVRSAIDDLMEAIRNDPAARAGDLERTYRIVRERFLPHTDFLLTTGYAVGQAWIQATPAQREALFAQFQTLLARTYALQLSQLQGENARFSYPAPSPPAPGSADAIVHTLVVAGSDTMPIDYRMRKTASGWKIYDIDMMGAWMIPVYRRQFAGQLASGGIDGLISYLAAHNWAG